MPTNALVSIAISKGDMRRIHWLFISLTAFCWYVVFGPAPQLRFENTLANYATALLLAVSWPATLAVMGGQFKNIFARFGTLILSVLISFPCVLVAVVAAWLILDARNGQPPSIVLIDEARPGVQQRSRTTFRLYRTDCGVFCRGGLVLRREGSLAFGLKAVETIWEKSESAKATLRIVGDALILEAVDGTFSVQLPLEERG